MKRSATKEAPVSTPSTRLRDHPRERGGETAEIRIGGNQGERTPSGHGGNAALMTPGGSGGLHKLTLVNVLAWSKKGVPEPCPHLYVRSYGQVMTSGVGRVHFL